MTMLLSVGGLLLVMTSFGGAARVRGWRRLMLAAGVLLVLLSVSPADDGMAACQQTHSFDVCADALF